MIELKSISKILFFSMCLVLVSSCGSDSTETASKATAGMNKTDALAKEAKASVDPQKVEEAKVKEASLPNEKVVNEKPAPVEEVKKPAPKKKVRKPRAKLVFQQPTHDYGFIMQGDKVTHDFHFTNIGDDDLLITRVSPSCGCTTPDYPKEAIAPGESGKIHVVFDSKGKLGRQTPHVDVYTNYKRKIAIKLEGWVDTERAKPPTVKKAIEEKVIEEKVEVETDTSSVGGER